MYRTKEIFAYSIFIFINLLFAIKYIERITEYYIPISLAIVLIYVLIWKIKIDIQKRVPFLKVVTLLILVGFVVGSIFVFKMIPVESLNVDRWSIITGFWDTALSGEYAYFGKGYSGNPPGPMPFYFILAFPFYLMGELGYYSLLGIFVFYGLLTYSQVAESLKTKGIILILISLFYLWEVNSRSNIFTNSVLILFSMVYILEQQEFNTKNSVVSGILVGLLLSTRNVFIIPYIITFLYLLRINKINIKQLTLIGIISITAYVVTFLPFIIGHYNDFLVMNPFIIQSSFFIPPAYTLGFILIAIVVSFFCKRNEDVYFFSSLSLFVSILIYFMYHVIHSGFYSSYFESIVDISYFIFCIPFLMYFTILRKQTRI